MGSNLVIVALPAMDDLVWKVSSEKVPHMTLMFLGEVNENVNVERISQFVEHALNVCEHGSFYLDVDYRGELGPDKADVLFFRNGWDSKWIKSLRGQLLQQTDIRAAFLENDQFPEWVPHLTLGYPDAPAKEIPDDRQFYSVCFDRIAVWTGDYEGPEFRLTWPTRYDECVSPSLAYSALGKSMIHKLLNISEKPWSDYKESDYTVEQWHAACLIHLHDGTPTSKSECKLPVKTPDGVLNRNGVHAAAAALAGARSELKAPDDQKIKAAKALVRYYGQLDEEPPESLIAHSGMTEDELAHHGVKGMKWGVTKEVHPALVDVPKKTRKEASADAEEFTRAKLYYGEGAGTRRKLIKAKVEAKKKDPLYAKAFDHFVSQTNLAERADQAHKERKRTDRKKATKKTAKGVGHIIRGNNQYANTTALVGVGTVSYLYNKKNQSVKHEEDGMKDTVELGAEFLEHHGVKGMRWGQRKEKIAVAREQKRAKKHDAKFERPDAQTHALIHNLAVVGFNNKIESINSKPHYDEAAKKGELDNEKLPITKQYHNEVNQLFKNELQSAANGVRNYSGSRQYDVEFTRLSPDPHDWGWSVKTRPVTDGTAGSGELVKVSHADDATIFRAIMDDNGLITGVALTEMSQSIFGELFVDDILSHHGVKGMKWGVRQHREGTLRRKAADQRAKAERAPKALIGTKAHKESVASKLNKQADKNEAKADQLARNIEKTGELRTKGVAKAKGGLRKLGRGINAVAVVLADSSWQNSTYSDAKHEAVHNHVAKELDSHIEKLQRSPKYRGKNLKADSNLRKEYYQDVAKVTDAAYRRAVKETYGENFSGTKTAHYVTDARGPRIEVRDKATGFPSSESPLSSLKDIQTRREVAKLTTAKHAATTDFPDLTIELTLDDNGQISGVGFVKLSDDSMAQSTFEHGAMFVEEYLEHHGIKGMKWGVTRAHIQASIERRQQKQDTVEAQRREARPAKDPVAKDSIGRSSNQHTTIKTKGGEDHPAHPEAIKIAELRQKLDKSGPAALSNKDLQEIQTRLNLERSVAQLESERKQGKSFVNKLLRQHGQQSFETLGREANKQASKEIGGQVGKAVGKNVVKGAAKQAGKLAYAL